MIASATPVPSIDALQTTFLGILPRLVSHCEFVFQRVRCPHRRDDYVAEVVALCWAWLVRLARRGKDASKFVSTLVTFASRQVWSGRRLSGGENSKDVLSGRARRRHGFRVETLPVSTRRPFDDFYGSVRGQHDLDNFEERLHANSQTPVPEQVAFRLDFRTWLCSHTKRDRLLINDMLQDERTLDLAKKFSLSASRVSQKRREFLQDWRIFCGEEECRPAPAKA